MGEHARRRGMPAWQHKLEIKPAPDASPEAIATLIAEGLESLPAEFRALQDSCLESLDDIARYLREDAARGCTLDEIDGWLEKLYEFGDLHRLWLSVAWAGSPGEGEATQHLARGRCA